MHVRVSRLSESRACPSLLFVQVIACPGLLLVRASRLSESRRRRRACVCVWPQVVFVEREVPVEVQRVVIREVPYKVEVDRPVVTVVEKAPPPPFLHPPVCGRAAVRSASDCGGPGPAGVRSPARPG